jgi:hypothetical protein
MTWGRRALPLIGPDGMGARPRHVWAEAFAGEAGWDVAWLREVDGEAVAWPCGRSGLGCEREVRIAPDDDWLAVCVEPFGCPAVHLQKRDVALFRLDVASVATALAESTRGLVPGVALLADDLVRLGVYDGANPRTGLYWCLSDGVPRLPTARGADDDLRVVITRSRDAGLRGLTSFDVVSWDDVVRVRDGKVVVDLSDVALSDLARFRDPGPLLGERYALVLDPVGGRVWVYGHHVEDLSTQVAARHLLEAVAWTPYKTVDPETLLRRTYPAMTSADRKNIDTDRVAARLKKQKQMAKDAVDAVGGGDWIMPGDATGSYRLELNTNEVRWLSDPEWAQGSPVIHRKKHG